MFSKGVRIEVSKARLALSSIGRVIGRKRGNIGLLFFEVRLEGSLHRFCLVVWVGVERRRLEN